MKRTFEIIFGVIGIAMDALAILLGVFLVLIVSIGMDWIDTTATGLDLVNNFIFVFAQLLWIPVISCIASFVLGLIAIIKVGKHPKLAGGLFLAAAVISSWLLFTIGAFQTLFYLIAGLMCFFRNQKDDFIEV